MLSTTPRHPLALRILHWIVALCVIGALAMGMLFGALQYEGMTQTFGDGLTNTFYAMHKSFGVLILLLMVVRAVFRRIWGTPDYDPPLSPFERMASKVSHLALYAVVIAQPVVGWAATAAGGYPIEFFGTVLPGFLAKNPPVSQWLYGLHGTLGWVLLALVLLHIAAAVRHWKVKQDNVMARISLP